MITAKKNSKIVPTNGICFMYRKIGNWYHHLKDFPGVLFDENGFIVFKTEAEYLNSTFLNHRQTLHVRQGISVIPGYKRFSDLEKKAIRELN